MSELHESTNGSAMANGAARREADLHEMLPNYLMASLPGLRRGLVPRIYCLETGGTFASTPSPDGRAPSLSLEQILNRHIGDVSSYAELELPSQDSPLHFGKRIDSSNAQPEDWMRLAKLLSHIARAPYTDGVVVTMGTDTMAYAASALSIVLPRLAVPVVLTGAQRGFDAPDSDAGDNFRGALLAASHLRPGVYVVFGGRIIHGAHASKLSTVSLEAFGAPCLAQQAGEVLLDRRSVIPPAALPTPPLSMLTLVDDFENGVKVEKIIPGYEPQWLEKVVRDPSVRGVVLEAFGVGGLPTEGPRSLLPVVERLGGRKPIVVKSQVPSGHTDLAEYAVGAKFEALGVLSAGAMTLETSTFLLKWLLGQGVTPRELGELWPAIRSHLTAVATSPADVSLRDETLPALPEEYQQDVYDHDY